jgi:hypothetical protein
MRGLSQIFSVNGMLTIGREIPLQVLWSVPMILNAITEKLKRQSKDDFKGLVAKTLTGRNYLLKGVDFRLC